MQRGSLNSIVSKTAGTIFLILFSFSGLHAAKHVPAKPIDLNTATVQQLEELPGVGPVTAQRILAMRQKSGHFRRVEDLLAVQGISDKRFARIRPYIMVITATPKPAAAPRPVAGPPPRPASLQH